MDVQVDGPNIVYATHGKKNDEREMQISYLTTFLIELHFVGEGACRSPPYASEGSTGHHHSVKGILSAQ